MSPSGSLAPMTTGADGVSSGVVTLLTAGAVGGSATGLTLTVMVLGDWSVSTPPLAVPPSSRTWKVKLA
jgi:hypothetical protein